MINLQPRISKNTNNGDHLVERSQETVIIASAAKLHRATILARVINSLSMIRQQWAYSKVKIWATIKGKRYNRMGFAINRIFRRNFHEIKFGSFQKIKKELLAAEQVEITQS